MEGETRDQAMARVAAVAGYRAAEDAARVADRMVIDRIISRDEDGNPRSLEAECARASLAEVVHGGGERWLRTATQLEPGHFVRVAGEWFRYGGLEADGRMRLMVEDREFHFGPGVDERFVWAEAEPF